jgi:hypothetical protein
VFDTALSQDVDFVILAGDVIHGQKAGPRGIELLRRNFQRLAEREIAVYWAAGAVDRVGRWPAEIPLPANVHRLDSADVTAIHHHRGEQRLATLLAAGWQDNQSQADGENNFPSERPYRIAVAYGPAEPEPMREAPVDYWALGGKHASCKLFSGRSIAQYCGSPQGRCPTEAGLHGCLLVQVDERGEAAIQMLPTDVVRWHHERLELTAGMKRPDFEQALHERTRHLSETNSERQLLVTWSIEPGEFSATGRDGQLAVDLRCGSLADEMVDRLRRDFGMASPGVWTVQLEATPPVEYPAAWYEEDTILGDLLRLVRHYQEHDEEPLEVLRSSPSSAPWPTELEEAMTITRPDERHDILRRVAALGVDLLRGERVVSGQESVKD